MARNARVKLSGTGVADYHLMSRTDAPVPEDELVRLRAQIWARRLAAGIAGGDLL